MELEAPPPTTAPETATTTTTISGSKALGSEFKQSISERLSEVDNLYFPRVLQPSATTSSDRKTLLLDLLSRDVAVFLERYGSQLTFDELKGFDALRDDYEVNWHLNHIRSLISPTEDELKSRSTTIKNRRRAYLDRLICDGQYFSEDAMREREPYLHHEYVGKFQDLSGRSMARPGERWFETLIRQSEEAMMVEKIREEQQRRGVARSDWVGSERDQQVEEEMEEEEEETEEEEDDDDNDEEEEKEKDEDEMGKGAESHVANGVSHHIEVHSDNDNVDNNNQLATATSTKEENLSVEELQERFDQFTNIMQQKFLSGEDHEHMDYGKIDEDESLDDHWMKEANHDAEEKYFDDV